MPRVLFRVDDGPGIGAGHLMRCHALAEAVLAQDGSATLLAHRGSCLHDLWRGTGVQVKTHGHDIGSESDLHATLQFAKDWASDWVVVDGYKFDTAWLESIAAYQRLMYLDDLGERDALASIVLNQNMGAEKRYGASYHQPVRALLGIEWLLLGRSWQVASTVSRARHVLVTLGGDDRDNLALAVMRELAADGRNFHADVVFSAPMAEYATTWAFANSIPRLFTLHQAPVDVVPLMSRSAVAICAGGVTALEAASLGVPTIIKVIANNQMPGAKALAAAGVAKLAPESGVTGIGQMTLDLLENGVERLAMSRRAHALFDKRGAERVLTAMTEMMQ